MSNREVFFVGNVALVHDVFLESFKNPKFENFWVQHVASLLLNHALLQKGAHFVLDFEQQATFVDSYIISVLVAVLLQFCPTIVFILNLFQFEPITEAN